MENLSALILLALRLLMALALYAFLGWAFLALWRDLKLQAKSAARQRVPALQAALLGDSAGEPLIFTTPEVTIGRHPSCEWMLPDETVSSRHARLTFLRDQWWLEDLGSRNGTYLNGEALIAPVVVTDMDEVRCGQVGFTIAFEDNNKEQA
ncbi:MAG: FHA domain-containing protein [Anaerolineales bacterium]